MLNRNIFCLNNLLIKIHYTYTDIYEADVYTQNQIFFVHLSIIILFLIYYNLFDYILHIYDLYIRYPIFYPFVIYLFYIEYPIFYIMFNINLVFFILYYYMDYVSQHNKIIFFINSMGSFWYYNNGKYYLSIAKLY